MTYDFGEAESNKERQAATHIANEVGVPNHHFDFSTSIRELYGLPQPQFLRMAPGLSTQSDPVSRSSDVQPFGSAIALLLTASWAVKNDIDSIYYAVHADDSHFTDNHQEYFDLLSKLTEECEGADYRISFITPYLGIHKHEVLQKGLNLGLPFKDTWSCAVGTDQHCGECAPCINRHGSFYILGVSDPVTYTCDPSKITQRIYS